MSAIKIIDITLYFIHFTALFIRIIILNVYINTFCIIILVILFITKCTG